MTNVQKIEKKIQWHTNRAKKNMEKIRPFINPEEVLLAVYNKLEVSHYVEGWEVLSSLGKKSPYDKNYYYEVCEIANAIETVVRLEREQLEKAHQQDIRIAQREAKKAEEKRIIESVNCPAINEFLENWKKAFLEFAQNDEKYKYWSFEDLTKLAEKEAEMKKLDLISRIQEKAGAIIDASYLRMGNNGSLNGKVIGEKKSVWVETILAGGYNIQCLHYRVLVN